MTSIFKLKDLLCYLESTPTKIKLIKYNKDNTKTYLYYHDSNDNTKTEIRDTELKSFKLSTRGMVIITKDNTYNITGDNELLRSLYSDLLYKYNTLGDKR